MGVKQTASGKWRGTVQVRGVRKSTASYSKKPDALDAEAKLRLSLRDGSYLRTEAGAVTFDVYARKVIARKAIKEQTRMNYLRDLRNHLSPTFGHMPLRHITPGMVDDWFHAQPVTPGRKSRYNVLSLVMREAERKDEIQKSPCRVEGARRDLSPQRPLLSVEEFRAILDASTQDDRMLWTLVMICGLRIGEALALDRPDIDLSGMEISVSKTWVQQTATLQAGTKNGGARTVAIPKWLAEDLATYMKRHPAVGAVPLFRNKDGERLKRHAAWDRWAKARTAACVEWAHIHDLRHMGLTAFSRNPDVRIEDVAERAGHKDLRSTAIYLHSDAKRQRDLVESMAAIS